MGDIIPYEIGAVTEGFHSPSTVFGRVDELVEHILKRTGADSYKLFLSEQGNYRIPAACVKKYKGTRQPEKPKWFKHIREHLYKEWGAQAVNNREADDALSITQHNYIEQGKESCIASRDKDLRIVPGLHYSWQCGEYQPEKPLYEVPVIGDIEAKVNGKGTVTAVKGTGLRFFYSQMLMGDTADNIPGAPKKGAKAAIDLLGEIDNEIELFDTVREAYFDAYKKQLDENGGIVLLDWRGKRRYRTIDQMMREQGILLWMQAFREDRWDREAYAKRYNLWS